METRILELYTTYDKKTKLFGLRPWPAVNKEDATRSFSQALAASDSHMALSPEDFVLFKIGTYDVMTGELKALEGPEKIIDALSIAENSGG